MMKKLYLLFTILTVTGHTFAQSSWKHLGQLDNAGPVTELTVDGNGTLYAKTATPYIYYSTDGGDNWQPFVQVHGFYNIGHIKASKSGSTLFATTSLNGVVSTSDYGATWKQEKINTNSHTGFGASTTALGVHPDLPKAIVSAGNSVYISHNNGIGWGLAGGLNFNPTDFHWFATNAIYASSANGLHFTSSLTSAWSQLAFTGEEVTDLEINSNGDLYASVHNSAGTGTVYHSTDDGSTWSALAGVGQNPHIFSLALDSVNALLYAATDKGVFRYDGSNWQAIGSEPHAQAIAYFDSDKVAMGSIKLPGAYVTTNSKTTFENKSKGLQSGIAFMAIDKDDFLYVSSGSSSIISVLDLNTVVNSSMSVDTSGKRILSLARDTAGNVLTGGVGYVYRLSGGGTANTLLASNATAPAAPVYNILFPQNLFTGNDGSMAMVQHAGQKYVDITYDEGATWSVLVDASTTTPTLANIYNVCIGETSAYVLGLAMPATKREIIAKTPASPTWNHLPGPTPNWGTKAIYVDNHDQLYALGNDSLYRYDSPNQSWEALNLNMSNNGNKVVELYFDANNRMYVLMYPTFSTLPQEGAFYSDDEGKTFTPIGFPVVNGNTVYLHNLGFDSQNVPFGISAGSSSQSSGGTGVFYFWDQNVSISEVKGTASSISVYPNPASEHIYIDLESHQETAITLTDLRGTLLQSTVTRNSENVLSLSNLAAGMYLLQVEQDGEKEVFKVMVK